MRLTQFKKTFLLNLNLLLIYSLLIAIRSCRAERLLLEVPGNTTKKGIANKPDFILVKSAESRSLFVNRLNSAAEWTVPHLEWWIWLSLNQRF